MEYKNIAYSVIAVLDSATSKTTVAVQKPAAAVAADHGVSEEVVAAITAAIAASEGSSNFVIRSVKRKEAGSRNPWARAAVADNTRAF